MSRIKISLKRLLSDGFFHILIGGSLTKVIAFMSSILVVRLVSKTEYAFLAYADNIYSYVLLLSGLGCATAILKFCASDDKEKNRAFYIFALKFGTVTQAVISFIVFMILEYVEIAFPEAKSYIYLMTFYPFLYFWIAAIESYMRALFKNKEFAYAGIIQSIVALVGSVGFVLLWGAYGVIVARYIALGVVIIYGLTVVKEKKGEGKNTEIKISFDEKKSFVYLGIALLIANVFSMIIPYNESFLINNVICDTEITANYKVACLIPSQLPFFTSAIVTYYFPIFARLKDGEKIWEEMKKVGVLTVFLIAGIAIIGIIVSPFIITIFYGEKYSDIFFLMTLLWIMNAINAGFRMLPMNILPAIGYSKFNVVVAFFTCIIHFCIDYVCIKMLGINGAVIAGGIVYLVSGLAYWYYLKKKTINR